MQEINDERELVRRVLLRNNAAFGELINQYQRLVFSIVYKMIPVKADREDLCQDIFIKVYNNLKNFKFDSKLSTWIARIAYTTSVNHLKKRKYSLLNDLFPEQNDDSDESTSDNVENASIPDAEGILYSKDLKEKINAELETLPAILKTIITLYHKEEMSYDEIGAITELPAGTVKSYLFRARKALKEKLLSKYKKEDLL
jgi:RNA polymerase sigma factor (sigma-70 family)